MAQTMRTISALTTLLDDNTTGAISPQDLRDAVIASLPPGFAAAYISASSATVLSDTSTWVPVAGTWTLVDSTSNWTMPTNGQFTWGGAVARQTNVQVALSMSCDSNLQQCQFGIALDGAIQTPSIVQRYVATGADIGAVSVVGHVDVSPANYISLVCRNITSAGDITAVYASLTIADFPA